MAVGCEPGWGREPRRRPAASSQDTGRRTVRGPAAPSGSAGRSGAERACLSLETVLGSTGLCFSRIPWERGSEGPPEKALGHGSGCGKDTSLRPS